MSNIACLVRFKNSVLSGMSTAELRKESRRLEVEIDLKLVSFSKLGSSYAQRESKYVLVNYQGCRLYHTPLYDAVLTV